MSLSELSEERGIGQATLQAAGIHRNDDGWWVIPYPHRYGIWKERYRNPDPDGRPKYMDKHGADFHLYNPLKIGPGEEEVWIAEGEFDTLALIDQGLVAIGVHGVSNVPDEERWGKEKTGFRAEWKLLFEGSRVVTMFDNDEAGRKAGRRLARALGGEAFDEWDEYSDVNDWWRADPQGLAYAVDRFRYRVFGMEGMG